MCLYSAHTSPTHDILCFCDIHEANEEPAHTILDGSRSKTITNIWQRLTLSSYDRVTLCVTAWVSAFVAWRVPVRLRHMRCVSASAFSVCERPPVVLRLQWQARNEGPPPHRSRSGPGGTSQQDHGAAAQGTGGSGLVPPSFRHTRSFCQCTTMKSHTTAAAPCVNKPEVIRLLLPDPHYNLISKHDISHYTYSTRRGSDLYLFLLVLVWFSAV